LEEILENCLNKDILLLNAYRFVIANILRYLNALLSKVVF